MTELNRKMASGAAWMVLLKMLERAIGLVSTLILARILVPADFGLVAMAMTVYGALEIMTSFSFDLALIQKRAFSRPHYDTAWTFNVLFGAFVLLAMLALAYPMAAFFGDDRVAPVMMLLGLAAGLRGLENIGVMEFQRDLKLRREFELGLARKIAGFVVTLAVAWVWRSYWALVAGILAQRVVSLGLTYAMHAYRPRFSLATAGELLSFSKWLALNNITIFAVHRTNDFIVGRLAGPAALGAYSVSYELANLPTTELVHPVGRALFPGFTQLAADLERLRQTFLGSLGLIAWLTLPLATGMAVLAEPLVMTLLGQKWTGAIPLVQLLSLAGAVRSLAANTGNVFLALGQPRTITYTSLLYLAVLLPTSIWGTQAHGVVGAAWAVTASALIQLAVLAWAVARSLGCGTWTVVRPVARPLLGCLACAATAHVAAQAMLDLGWPAPLRLLVGSAAGAAGYLLVMFGSWVLKGRPATAPESVLLPLLGRMVRRPA